MSIPGVNQLYGKLLCTTYHYFHASGGSVTNVIYDIHILNTDSLLFHHTSKDLVWYSIICFLHINNHYEQVFHLFQQEYSISLTSKNIAYIVDLATLIQQPNLQLSAYIDHFCLKPTSVEKHTLQKCLKLRGKGLIPLKFVIQR